MSTFLDVVPKLCGDLFDATSVAKRLESGDYYFGPGSSVVRAVSMRECNERVRRLDRDGSITRGHAKVPSVLAGLPMQHGDDSAVDSFHSLRGRSIKLDHYTTDSATRLKSVQSKASASTKLAKNKPGAFLRSCQHRDHAKVAGKQTSVVHRLPLCKPCADLYRFMRPSARSSYLPIGRLQRDKRLLGDAVLAGRREVFIGWFCASASETALTSVAINDVPVADLDAVGVLVTLHFYAFKYPVRYSCLRLLDPCRPERAVWLLDHRHVFAPRTVSSSNRLWWRAVEERGVITRTGLPVPTLLSCEAGPDVTSFTRFVWTDNYCYSMSFLDLVAGVRGMHSRFRLVISVRLAPSDGRGEGEFPAVSAFTAEEATIGIKNAESVSFAFALCCVNRAVDAVEGQRQKTGRAYSGVPLVRLNVECSPLHSARSRRMTDVLRLALSAGSAELVPLPTAVFSQWALTEAKTISVDPGVFSVAAMYPFGEADLATLRETIEKNAWGGVPEMCSDDVASTLSKVYLRDGDDTCFTMNSKSI